MKYLVMLIIAAFIMIGLLTKCVHDLNADVQTLCELNATRSSETFANFTTGIDNANAIKSQQELLNALYGGLVNHKDAIDELHKVIQIHNDFLKFVQEDLFTHED